MAPVCNMSKDSNISKDVDPVYNSNESGQEQTNTSVNGTGEHSSDPPKDKNPLKPEPSKEKESSTANPKVQPQHKEEGELKDPDQQINKPELQDTTSQTDSESSDQASSGNEDQSKKNQSPLNVEGHSGTEEKIPESVEEAATVADQAEDEAFEPHEKVTSAKEEIQNAGKEHIEELGEKAASKSNEDLDDAIGPETADTNKGEEQPPDTRVAGTKTSEAAETEVEPKVAEDLDNKSKTEAKDTLEPEVASGISAEPMKEAEDTTAIVSGTAAAGASSEAEEEAETVEPVQDAENESEDALESKVEEGLSEEKNPQEKEIASDTSKEDVENKDLPQESIADSEPVEHKDTVVKTEKKSEPTASPDTKEPVAKPWDDVDFATLDKAGVVTIVELLAKEENPILAEKVSRSLKSRYEIIHKEDRKKALDQFVAEGNEPDGFAFRFDELDNRFDGAFKLLRDKKFQFVKSLERSKEKNLAEKIRLLEELRGLVDSEETTSSIQSVKKIQDEWRELGPVPGKNVKTLWANYHALMDRYYDQRSIYFELKELDRKKNLQAKLELCEKAEKLVGVEDLKQAINDLNELHEEFKHLGPVPKADQQSLWERFKHASDQVYARRKEFIKHLKEDLKINLDKKLVLADQVQEYYKFESDRITDWNKKTKGILEIQKQWEAIGGLPRDAAKEVNKKFWGAFKGFFHNKGLFFKKLEGERISNLEKKKEIVVQAESLKDSVEWKETSEKLKQLQKDWRNIGPVPEKFRNSIYGQFKEACDLFFSKKRSQNKELEKDYIVNLEKKQKVCASIETMITAGEYDLDKFLELKQQFNQLGYVPAAEVKNIRSQFSKAANDFLDTVPDELAEEARQIKYDIQFEKLKKGPNADRRRDQKQQGLRRDITNLENDIATWKNNLEFFANSKTATKVKEEFTVKIDQAGKKLQELKSQFRALRELR